MSYELPAPERAEPIKRISKSLFSRSDSINVDAPENVVKGSKDVRSGEAESERVMYALAVQIAQRKKDGRYWGY
jgi:hypothetical protein